MSKRAGDTEAARKVEAERRKALEGNTQFADLGEPIKKLLMLVSKDVSTDDFKLLTKITVRQLAKVFDMLSLEEDPDKIMAWLTREARKAQGIEDPAAKKKHPKGVATGANRDAIAFYKELERKNLELVEAMKREQEEREEQRQTNIAERRRRREEAVQRAAEAKQRALEKGEVVSSKESLRKTDIRDIVGAFDRAAAKSNADNSASVTDTEWWKQDSYRRDFEKNGPKGAAWNRVIEGGSQKATEAELAAREEWFRSQCWWKSDKYKRDWLASRDAEWWKEETYIRDWQDHGEKGAMWTAADETSGFNRKGDRRPAATVELARRVEWYKNNGPKGIVKLWCALSEGVADRCTLEEKRERDDYYKNGDWWKSDRNKLKLSDAPDASIVTFAGSAGEDREWWKDESYRRDFSSGGQAWKAASEKSAVTGDKVECTPAEAAKREEWFAENWWKAQKYADDFRKNGDKGKLWRARSEEDSASPSGKQCKESEAALRAEWYKSAEDREWWKDERFLRDFQEHGNKGAMWTAAWKEAGDNATGDKNPAKPDVLKAREEWYNSNWWKAEKYVKDFQVHGKQGTAWRAGSAAAHEDLDWWKQGEYVRKFAAAKKNTVENFWQDPKYIEDYFTNGAKGKGWIAAHAAAASVGKGDEVRANPEEVAAREKWYEDNWWKSPECVRDFATHGSDGKAWTAATRGSKDRASPEELGRRREFFQPQTAATASFDAMFEADATAPVTGTFAAPQTVADREEKLRKDWWKSAKVAEDYRRNGKNSQLFKAATAEVAAMGLGDQPMYQASPEELKEREAYFDSEFWKSPAALSAYLKNGDASPFVKAADLAAVANGKASDPKFQASLEEIAERKAVLDADWWKAPEVREEYKKMGAASPLFKAASREDAAKGLGNDPAHQASAEEIERRKAYFDDDWWRKSPEVRAEYMKMGTASPLFKAATMEDAAKGLGSDPAHQASAEELERRKAFFEKDWLKSPEVLDDFVKRGKASPFLKASSYDAAIRGLANDPAHQCAPEEQKEREQFFEDNWWKAPSVMSDFLKKGEDSPLFKAASQDAAAKGLGSDPKFQATPEEIAERKAFFDAEWWKAPEVREEYKKMGLASPLFKAATRDDASQGLGNDPAHQATADELERRRAFFDDNVEKPQWWHDDEHMREAAAARDPTFWKNPEYVEDFLKNGANGRKWRAGNAAAGSTGKADEVPASEDELARRREFFEKNFWMAPEYKEDWERHGDKGTLWQQSQPNGKGTVVDDADRKARVAFYKPKAAWQLRTQPTSEEAKLAQCTPAESLDRRQWYEDNWWKSPEVKEDFEKYGRNSKLLKAATQEAADMGLADNPMYQASPEEVEARAQYFEKAGDNEWWKDPAVVDDYVKHGKEGAKWQARTLRESEMSMGLEAPATKDELEKRAEWFEKNFWKTPAALDDYVKNGNKGAMWKRGARPGVGETPEDAAKNAVANPASQAEIDARRQWFESHAPVNTDEANRRREWMERQLTDEEKVARRTWVKKSTKESKRIANDELVDALAALNDGQKPSEEQLKEIEDAVRRRRAELGFKPANQEEMDTITQEEFVVAVADTNFYLPQTDEEKLRAEEEALAAMQMEELNRQTEEAAYLAMEAEEERIKAGLTEEEAAALAAATQDNDEEAAFLDELEQDGLEAKPNEDDAEVTEDQDAAWNDFIENQKNADEELTPEEEARLAAEEEARLQAEAAAAEAADEAWASEEFEGEEDAPADAEPEIDDAEKEELEALVEEDPEEQWDNDEEDWGEDAAPEEEEIDELLVEEKGQPLQWKLPLPEVTNPQFLKSYFTVIKYTPSHSLLGGKQKRVWVVDHFTRCFYNLEKSGKIKKEHAANKLLQLERNVSDPLRLRLMFFDAAHSYELQFYSPQERERFYESASAIRPSIRVYAPDLTNQDASVEACTTTVDGVGANTVSVTVNNAAGKPVARELSGECKINASKLLTEPLTLWCGTFNLSGHHPPRNSTELNDWMPKDKYDIYAVAVQEASYRKEESEWFEYVQHHLGKEYLTLASMSVWDTLLIVLSRKKHLLKITNVEGSTKATVHKSVCGTKGGIGISLRFLETSMAFVTCHLAARLERNAMRNTNLEEIVDGLQLAIRETDFCNQFNHVFFFGAFNYRLELDNAAAAEMIEAKQYSALLDYDQLTIQRRDEGILHGFQEPPITFPPTYRMQVGSEQYMAEKGNAPSYCARVMTRSMANTWVKCTGYKSFRNVQVSEHLPVHATFIVRCVRPTMSCFMKQQSPIPQFIFEEVSFSESTGPIIKKPQLMITSPFTGVVKNLDAGSASTASPSWNTIPKVESVTQAQEYLETCHFILIIKDASEKREDKAHRGTAHLPLFSRVIGLQDMQQEFDADIMSHGKLVGKLVGKFRWEAAPLQM